MPYSGMGDSKIRGVCETERQTERQADQQGQTEMQKVTKRLVLPVYN